jgi:hypothetical protein
MPLRADDLVAQHADTFDGHRLVAIISHADFDAARLQKRQAIEYDPTRPVIQPFQQDDDDDDGGGGDKKSGNSTWKPDPKAPALARYTIISPIQIIVVLILALVVLPAVLLTSAYGRATLRRKIDEMAHSQYDHSDHAAVWPGCVCASVVSSTLLNGAMQCPARWAVAATWMSGRRTSDVYVHSATSLWMRLQGAHDPRRI